MFFYLQFKLISILHRTYRECQFFSLSFSSHVLSDFLLSQSAEFFVASRLLFKIHIDSFVQYFQRHLRSIFLFYDIRRADIGSRLVQSIFSHSIVRHRNLIKLSLGIRTRSRDRNAEA